MTNKNVETNQNGNVDSIIFFKASYYDSGECKSIEIKRIEFIALLQSFGFARYTLGSKLIYVQIQNNIVSEVSKEDIIDTTEDYIKSLPEEISLENGYKCKRDNILEKLFRGLDTFFCVNFLNRLRLTKEIVFNADSKTESFFYFKNGFVCCTAEGWKFKPYRELTFLIWKHQIIEREFHYYNKFIITDDENFKPVFYRFMLLVSNMEIKRFQSLCSIAGFYLHGYTNTKLIAAILTDSKISEKAEGRTGKNLFGEGLSKMRPLTLINGRDFRADNKYKYALCNYNTQIIHIADLKSNIPFNVFYNDITEGIIVEKKNEKPFSIKSKLLLSSNQTIKIEGASDKDRSVEFEFSNYFSDIHKPEHEFGHWFFEEWTSEEWNRFDNFMCYCTTTYIRNGIIQAEPINLNQRKLLEETAEEFIDFMQGKNFKPVSDNIESANLKTIEFDVRYNVKTLQESFKESYTDFEKISQKTFNRWLQKYADLQKGFGPFVKEKQRDWKKSNNKYFIIFRERI